MYRNKKAFTVVELVIVIAVLAILAAVLIPTFVGLVAKANESNTLKLVKNMNTALAAGKADGAHATMSDALKAAKDFGYDLEKINANKTETGDNEILWDSVNDCFVYVKDNQKTYVPESQKTKTVLDYQYWRIVTDAAEATDAKLQESPYSSYLACEVSGELNVNKGIDVGTNTGITKINYVNNGTVQTVSLCTNSFNTDIDINETVGDTINHFGTVGKLTTTHLTTTSYHEYGKLAYAYVTEGKVVAEANANIDVAFVLSVSAYVQEKETGVINYAYAATADVKESSDSGDKKPLIYDAAKTEEENREIAANAGSFAIAEQTGNQPEDTSFVAIVNKVGYGSLQEAIDAATPGSTVYMVSDVYLANCSSDYCINITKSVSIEGNNHRIAGKLANRDDRLVHIHDMDNGTVELKNLTVTQSTDSTNYSYCRGVNLYRFHARLNMDNVTVSIPHYYAVNIAIECDNAVINMNHCSIKGWSTVYNHSDYISLTANNSSFDADNPTHGGESNSFSNIIVAEYYKEVNGIENKYNNFTFNNCSFTASKQFPEADVKQVIADIRSPMSNTLVLNNCTFEKCASPRYIKVCERSEYNAISPAEYDGTNRVIINGEDVTNTADYIYIYVDD